MKPTPRPPGRVIALSADLYASREAPRRSALAERIEQVLTAVNDAHRDEWIAPLESTRGIDEVSAVLRRRKHAFDIIAAVNLALWPQRFRFALADGPLDVTGPSASDMDGPAFHGAADALARARDEHLTLAVAFEGTTVAQQRMAESTAELHQTLVAGWTEQIATTIRFRRPPGRAQRTQAEVAAMLGNTQQAVSDSLRRGHLRALIRAEDTLRAWLEEEDLQ